jgi:GNAT superfamily N-acetyltransferase
MRYLAVASISIGEAWLTDSGQAAAFWLRHDAKPHGARFMFANFGYLFGCGLKATRRSLRAEKDLSRRLPNGPFRFLWTIGVAETARGTGQVRELLEPHLQKADRAGIPVYLETVVERNIAIYRHYGFEVDNMYTVDTGLPVAFMRHSPVSNNGLIEKR